MLHAAVADGCMLRPHATRCCQYRPVAHRTQRHPAPSTTTQQPAAVPGSRFPAPTRDLRSRGPESPLDSVELRLRPSQVVPQLLKLFIAGPDLRRRCRPLPHVHRAEGIGQRQQA